MSCGRLRDRQVDPVAVGDRAPRRDHRFVGQLLVAGRLAQRPAAQHAEIGGASGREHEQHEEQPEDRPYAVLDDRHPLIPRRLLGSRRAAPAGGASVTGAASAAPLAAAPVARAGGLAVASPGGAVAVEPAACSADAAVAVALAVALDAPAPASPEPGAAPPPASPEPGAAPPPGVRTGVLSAAAARAISAAGIDREEAQRAHRHEFHPQARRLGLDAFAGCQFGAFDAERRVLALELRLAHERATDARVQLEHEQLQRDDPDQRERDQRDPDPPANQPVEGSVAREPA